VPTADGNLVRIAASGRTRSKEKVMRRLVRRAQLFLVSSSIGGSVLVLEGCDPTVRDTVVTGVQGASTSLITTFIQAFFESLQDNQDDGTVTTV
jgi:hypothetical protein